MGRARTICIITDERIHAVVLTRTGDPADGVAQAYSVHGQCGVALGDLDATALAAVIRETLERLDTAPGGINLVIPMNWCLTHVLERPSKRAGIESLGFELEEFLPVPIDAVTAVYLPLGPSRVLAAGVLTEPIRKLLGELTEMGITVDQITVDALVGAFAGAAASRPTSCIVADEHWVRALCFFGDDKTPETLLLPRPADSTRGHLPRLIEEQIDAPPLASDFESQIIWLGGYHDSAPARCQQKPDDGSVLRLATCAASSATRLNLRCGALAPHEAGERVRRRLRHCATAAVALLVVCAGGLLGQTHALSKELRQVQDAQARVYRETFDTVGSPPPGAALRIASERIRLEALRHSGAHADGTNLERTRDPITTLRDWVASLPADVRVFLTHARIDESHVQLRGKTREHRDAERLAEPLQRIAGLIARPPRTTRDRDGAVEFSISGQWNSNE